MNCHGGALISSGGGEVRNNSAVLTSALSSAGERGLPGERGRGRAAGAPRRGREAGGGRRRRPGGGRGGGCKAAARPRLAVREAGGAGPGGGVSGCGVPRRPGPSPGSAPRRDAPAAPCPPTAAESRGSIPVSAPSGPVVCRPVTPLLLASAAGHAEQPLLESPGPAAQGAAQDAGHEDLVVSAPEPQ